MFTVVKIREGLARNDYKDPGWYNHPVGTVAYEWTGAIPLAQQAAPRDLTLKAQHGAQPTREFRVRKPTRHAGH